MASGLIKEVFIYILIQAATQTNIFNPKKDPAKGAENNNERNELKNIVLNDVRITDDDKQKNKLFDIQVNDLDLDLEDKDSTVFLFSAKANMLIHSLAFKLQRGSFVKEKTFRGNFDLRYDKKLKQIQLDSVDICLLYT